MIRAMIFYIAEEYSEDVCRRLVTSAHSAGADEISVLAVTREAPRGALPVKAAYFSRFGFDPEMLSYDALKELFTPFGDFDIYIFGSSRLERECAAMHSERVFADVTALETGGGGAFITRPSYDGELDARIFSEYPFSLSVREGSFGACADACESSFKEIRLTTAEVLENASISPLPSKDPIGSAKRLIVGGRGVGSKEGFDRLRALADGFTAALGSTRPAASDGYMPLSTIVGMSGSVSNAESCLLLGVSGAEAFLFGIEHAGFVMSVNSDPDADVFGASDAYTVGDLNDVVDALEKLIGEEKKL